MLIRRPSVVAVLGSLLLSTAACDNTLETGYTPRSLSASEADRRSYYAPAFSPAAHPEKEGTGFNFNP